MCMHVLPTDMSGSQRDQKRESNPPNWSYRWLEVGTGDRTLVVWNAASLWTPKSKSIKILIVFTNKIRTPTPPMFSLFHRK